MRHILCPVDFSELSARALKYAGALAERCGARITVLYANSFSPPPYFTPGQVARLEQEFHDSERQAEAELHEFVKASLNAIPAAAALRVLEAPPADAIRRVVEEVGADQIAMGTHGRSRFNRLMLGSVAERVLRESLVPVLTVREGAEAAPAIRRILAPVNNTVAARKVLATAAELARCFGATLTLLHVEEPHSATRIEDLCAWVPSAQRKVCQIREVTRKGEPAQEILGHASKPGCDLLVVGAQHRRFFDSTVIGSTTVRVVRHASCPVLTVAHASSEAFEPAPQEALHAV